MQQSKKSYKMKQMSEKKYPTFKHFFQAKFKEWENLQKNQRSYISAYARWLSENGFDIEIKQQMASDWYHGKYVPRDDGYLLVIEEKLGNEIYDILEINEEDRPDANRFIVNRKWNFMPLEWRIRIAEETAKYEEKNLSKQLTKSSKRRKPRNIE